MKLVSNAFVLIVCKIVPVGGALKPTDVEALWVHVTCAWFRPEVGFLNHEKMEPAIGVLRIPTTSFLKVNQRSTILFCEYNLLALQL